MNLKSFALAYWLFLSRHNVLAFAAVFGPIGVNGLLTLALAHIDNADQAVSLTLIVLLESLRLVCLAWIIAAGVLVAYALFGPIRDLVATHRGMVCPKCLYPLEVEGDAATCPECGTTYTVDELRTKYWKHYAKHLGFSAQDKSD
jgi:hypothetical protein